jgi:hypothetical protein
MILTLFHEFFNNFPIDAAAIPFPSHETTHQVTNMKRIEMIDK